MATAGAVVKSMGAFHIKAERQMNKHIHIHIQYITLGTAIAGAVVKSIGAFSASANETTRASGLRLSSLALLADIRRRAAAPSLSDEELAVNVRADVYVCVYV
jgi:hypothetical protein